MPRVAPRASRRVAVWLLPALILAVFLPRLAVFPINENLYGDAIPRTEMAEAWARAPHVITSFGDGTAQFGPLHLYLIAAALAWFDRTDAARFVSLLFGVLTVVPLLLFSRRLFGATAAACACLCFAVWGMHVQLSTTGGSEALALFLMIVLFALFARGLETHCLAWFAAAALASNLACATRYDAWMYVPLLSVVPAAQWRTREGVRAGLLFAALCLPYPVWWMYGNAVAHGDALYPLTYIDAFHAAWAAEAGGGWPEIWLRAQGLGFWPAIALFTLTPGVAIAGITGMAATWRARPDTRWVTALAVVPVLYYAARTTVLFDFVPLARFTVLQLVLLLPFVTTGIAWWAQRLDALTARRLVAAGAALAFVMPLALGLFTFRADGRAATTLRPLSPTSTNPRGLMAAATFLRREVVGRGLTVAVDSDRFYQDLQLGFFAALTETTGARLRWPDFRQRVERAPPDYLVRFDDGELAGLSWVTTAGTTLTMAGVPYEELRGFSVPLRVYRRARPSVDVTTADVPDAAGPR